LYPNIGSVAVDVGERVRGYLMRERCGVLAFRRALFYLTAGGITGFAESPVTPRFLPYHVVTT
jgi:hypothetical protein